MASIINASSTGSGGIVQTADASGVLQLQSNGTLALNVDTSANISVGTTTANTIAGNSNARYFAVQGDGTLSSADGRIVLSNPRAYASISANATTAGRVFFQLTNGSGGTITDAANIDAIATGSGGASGYGIDIRLLPKQDNGSSAEAARINFGGNFILKGGTVTANGTGVTFPATQSASTDANCLDDYEEGTWTPSYSGGLSGITYGSVRNGYYRKIGSQVTIWFGIMTDGLTITSSSLTITGLPFTSSSSAGSNGAVNIWNAVRWVSSPPVVGQIETTSTSITLYNNVGVTGAGVDPTQVTTGNMSTGTGNRNFVFATATYIATA